MNLLDDMELPDGSLSNSVTNFANEWRSDSSVSGIIPSSIRISFVCFSVPLVLLQQILVVHLT